MINYIAAVVCLTVVSATAFKQPLWVLQYVSLSRISIIVFALLVCLPFGKQIIGKEEPVLPFKKYLALLSLAQLTFCFITFMVACAFLGNKLELLKNLDSFSIVGLPNVKVAFWFPWSLFGIWALMIAYIPYQQNHYPQIGNIVRLYCPPYLEFFMKGSIDYILSAATLACLCLSMTAAFILIGLFIEIQLGFNPQLLHSRMSLISLSCIFPIVFWTLRSRAFFKITKYLSLGQIPVLMMAIVVPVLISSSVLGDYLGALSNQSLLIKSCAYLFEQDTIQTRLAALFLGWCIVWVPTAGSFIARYSQGRTVREVVVGVLFLPSVLYSLYFIISDKSPLLNFMLSPTFEFVLSIMTVLLVCMLLKGRYNNLFLYTGFIALPNPPKKDRFSLEWAPRLLGTHRSFMVIIMTLLSCVLMYLIGGWSIIAFQLLTVAALIISIFYISLSILCVYCLKQHSLFLRLKTGLMRR